MHAPMHIHVTDMEQRLLFPLHTVFLAAFRGTIQMIASDMLTSHSFIHSFIHIHSDVDVDVASINF
jgi:hypothetical protein